MGRSMSLCFTLITALLASQFLFAQSSEQIKIPKLTNEIRLDGRIDDDEWGDIDTLSFVSHWPAFSLKRNSQTNFRIAYDGAALYFSSVCYNAPEKIQGPTFERDNWTMTMDQVTIILDTYNDNENALIFSVTPTGSRIDVTVFNDAQGSSPIDISWNSFWQARSIKFDQGWSMEARIPFSSLRFQATANEVTMGLIVYRYNARDREMDIYPIIEPHWGFWSFAKPSQAKDVVFENIKNKRPWFTSPYGLARTGYHHERPDEEPIQKVNDDKLTFGLDVQHAITDNMNLDLTYNTDFAQVEADDQVVNLSRFSLFFPEKRRFFLERSSIMEFGFENNNRLFYSRRIGIHEGRIQPLWGGARLVGRIKNYDVGFVNIQSREEGDIPSENFGVLRLRRKVSTTNSYVGAILTSRTDFNGNRNFVYGADAILKLFKNDYLKINLANSYNSSDSVNYSNVLAGRKRIYILWENRSQVGFNYALSYSQVDNYYVPGLGFEARTNFRSFGDRLSYGWFPKNRKNLRYLRADLNATAFLTNTTGRLESTLIAPAFSLEWNKNNTLAFMYSSFYDNVPEAFKLADNVEIPKGEYVNRDIGITYETPTVNFLTASLSVTKGTFYDGDRLSAGITPTFTISKYLTLSGFYQYNYVGFTDKPDYVAHVARFKIATSINVKLSINAFIQANSLSKVSSINFRLRYNQKDGNDFFLVYNEGLNNEGRSDPEMPFSEFRSVTVKYIHTFHITKR
jgi:hypothetical protein